MVNYCCVTNCNSNSRNNKNVGFFSIPIDPIRQLQWLEKIGRLDLLEENPVVVNKRRVCGNHFENVMFAGLSKTKLKKDAIPTIFQEGVGCTGTDASTAGTV